MFKHFIVTRFNLKVERFSQYDKSKSKVLSKYWLDNRFILFEQYCLPSIINQSNKNFIWFVLFCKNTPTEYINKIKEYEKKYNFFKPLFLDNGEDNYVNDCLNSAMAKYTESFDEYIITSRIDNDDAYHADMIMNIQNNFNKQIDVFISFINGMQYDVDKGILAKMQYKNNHFISRIEKKSNRIETVIFHDHTFINNIAQVKYINTKQPMWLEVIHKGNLLNTLDSFSLPIFSKRTFASFNIHAEYSVNNTMIAMVNYLKIRLFNLRNIILKKIKVYDLIKKYYSVSL